jgi:hypothetical protein
MSPTKRRLGRKPVSVGGQRGRVRTRSCGRRARPRAPASAARLDVRGWPVGTGARTAGLCSDVLEALRRPKRGRRTAEPLDHGGRVSDHGHLPGR